MDLPQYLSATLKMLRHTRGWSLSRLASETGVSKAMLGQIERNESSPTVATLWKIATGLNVPLSTFISDSDASAPQAYDPDQQAMTITPIFPWDSELRFDHFSVTLAPGAFSESSPHERGVIEHIVVIAGTLEIRINDVWQTLEAGSGVRFAGDKTHAYRNGSGQTTHFHSLIHYPKEKAAGEPAAKHDDE